MFQLISSNFRGPFYRGVGSMEKCQKVTYGGGDVIKKVIQHAQIFLSAHFSCNSIFPFLLSDGTFDNITANSNENKPKSQKSLNMIILKRLTKNQVCR